MKTFDHNCKSVQFSSICCTLNIHNSVLHFAMAKVIFLFPFILIMLLDCIWKSLLVWHNCNMKTPALFNVVFLFYRKTNVVKCFRALFPSSSPPKPPKLYMRENSSETMTKTSFSPDSLLIFTMFSLQAYTIQGQYAIPHPDVSSPCIFFSLIHLILITKSQLKSDSYTL